jgi:CheY-like chemotaxis protein
MTVRLVVKDKVAAAPVVVAPLDLRGLRVLVVNSQNDIRESREAMLRSLTMEPAAAEGPETTLAVLQQAYRDGHPFQLVLLEALEQRMDGLTLATKIRSREKELGHPRVIIIVSAGERGEAARYRQAGISGYLTLPISPAEFAEAAAMVLTVMPGPDGKIPLVTKHELRERRTAGLRTAAEANAAHGLAARLDPAINAPPVLE